MKRLPVWMLAMLALLTALLMWVGIHDKAEIGPLPMILAALWIVFILASLPRIFSRDEH